jgi:4-azaleucine resistance transporter AzlC
MEISSETGKSNAFRAWMQGMLLAFPIIMGYIPIGIAFGILAIKAGVSPINSIFLSLFVYAGSSQLIAIGLIESQATTLSIILTTFIVNLRHLLMSASVSPYLKGWRMPEVAAFAFQLTDETFAVHSTRFTSSSWRKAEVFGINVTAQAGWLLGTWLGITVGQFVHDVEPLALDYALPAMFLALLVMQVKERRHIMVALVSGLLSVIFLLGGWGKWNVLLAAFLGATFGVGIEQWTKRQSC